MLAAWNSLYLVFLCGVLGLTMGCANTPSNQTDLIATEVATAESTAALTQVFEANPTTEAASTTPQNLVIWWPEPLAPLDNESAAEILSEQISAFQRENPSILVEFRLKKSGDVGGLLSTLHAAAAVAPGALPDLTLLHRADLLSAVQDTNSLLLPLDNTELSALLVDIPAVGVALGSVDEVLFGLPYALSVQHVAARGQQSVLPRFQFDDLLGSDSLFFFPAGQSGGVNEVFLSQYVAAGGQWTDLTQNTINANALFDTLAFYEQAVAEGVIDPAVLEYTSPAAYQEAWLTGSPSAWAAVSSTTYLRLLEDGQLLSAGVIPTRTGQPVSVVDGWLWVVTTPDSERQARAVQFLLWMMNAGRQGQYTRAVPILPSQQSALRQMSDRAYTLFIEDLIANAVPTLTESESGAAARAIQNALAEVINGGRTAEEATQDVLLQLESS